MEDDQEFWKKLTEMEEDWKGKQAVESQGDTIKAVPEIRHDDNDTATMMASLSVSGKKEEKMPRLHAPQPTVRRPRGEDVFTESCVKEWQGSRIKAWEGRYVVCCRIFQKRNKQAAHVSAYCYRIQKGIITAS